MFLDGSRSNFPNEIDEIMELFTLPYSKKTAVKRYQELLIKEKLTNNEKEEMARLKKDLQHYIFDVEKWNLFGDILVNMQKFFKDDVEPYIENKKKEFNDEINKFAFIGDWDKNKQYLKNNIVKHNGYAYIAKKDNKGQEPSEHSSYWSMIAEKGDKGEPSLNINYKGRYDDKVQYEEGDAVIYKGYWFYARQSTKGNAPSNMSYWDALPNQVYIGNNPPSNTTFKIWVDTSNDTHILKAFNGEDWIIVDDKTASDIMFNNKETIKEFVDKLNSNVVNSINGKKGNVTLKTGDISTSNDKYYVSKQQLDNINKISNKANQSDVNKKVNRSGDTMTGILKAYNNSTNNQGHVRNIYISTKEPTSSDMSNGDIWLVYK